MTARVLEPTTEQVQTVADCIQDGGVVVAPSDTNLALTVDPWNPDAIQRAYDVKDRPAHKPLTLFIENPEIWRRYGKHDDPELVDGIVDQFWP